MQRLPLSELEFMSSANVTKAQFSTPSRIILRVTCSIEGLVRREILMSAYDRSTSQDISTDDPGYTPGSLPDNIKSDTAFRAFKDAKVCLLILGKWATTLELPQSQLGLHSPEVWPSGELVVDNIIPMLLYDKKLCEEL